MEYYVQECPIDRVFLTPVSWPIWTRASSRWSTACSTITWPQPVCQTHISTSRTLCPWAHEYYTTFTSIAAPAAARLVWSSTSNPTRCSDSTAAAATPSLTCRSSRWTSCTSSCSFDKCAGPGTYCRSSPTKIL